MTHQHSYMYLTNLLKEFRTCIILSNKSISILFYLVIVLPIMISICDISMADRHSGRNLIEQKHGRYGYVWFETNTPSYLEQYLQHAKKWETIGRPIITARIYNIEDFIKRLNRENIPVTGGFKTSNAFDGRDYHDIEAWREIARVARNVSNLTNGRPVILENEGALQKLESTGITSIDYEKLVHAINSQDWPPIWFWYAPNGWNETIISMSSDIARAVMNSISNARLIEPSSCGFVNSPEHPHWKRLLELTLTINPHPISIIYLDNSRYNFWHLSDTPNAIDNAAADTVILYPGHEDFGSSYEVKNSFYPTPPRNLHITKSYY